MDLIQKVLEIKNKQLRTVCRRTKTAYKKTYAKEEDQLLH